MSPAAASVGRPRLARRPSAAATVLAAAAVVSVASSPPSGHALAPPVPAVRHTRQYRTRLHSHPLGDQEGDDNVVSVTVQRTLPEITPRDARMAWMEYHWTKGGGLPIAIRDDPSVAEGATEVRERTILPIFMKERVDYEKSSTGATSLDLHYKVIESGPFFADLIPGTHSAAVTFDATNEKEGGCVMTWKVDFSTTRWTSLYEAVTLFTIGTAATTVQEASSTPRLFSAKTTIDCTGLAIDPESARAECLDFVFAFGGGLPLLPPIPYGNVLREGGGSARQNLLRIPPLMTESVVDAQSSDGMAEFSYSVRDPGWLTFPFLLHSHLGRVKFASTASSDLVIEWDVEIRPYKIASWFVEPLVEMTVTTLLRNLRVRLTEPGAVVEVKPPRGNTNLLGERQTSFGAVAKDSWLGGVLDAHLKDTRSTTEQTMSLLQPWNWGRSGSGDETDDVQFRWTEGHIQTT